MRKSKLENPLKMDKSLHLINNNAVGKEINKANRKVATKVLEDAKSIEIEISKDAYRFVRKLHKKSRLDKDIFIQKKSNNFDISIFLLLMNEINLAFTKVENELDANDNILNNGKLPNTNEVRKRDKNQRKRDALKLAKIDWELISKDYYVEIEKVNNGAKWMRKEKICVLVPTAKIEIYKQNGYL